MSNTYPIVREWENGGYNVRIDESLSDTSSNPVANHVVKAAIDAAGGGGTTDFDVLDHRPKYSGSVMTHETDVPQVPDQLSTADYNSLWT